MYVGGYGIFGIYLVQKKWKGKENTKKLEINDTASLDHIELEVIITSENQKE